MKELTHQRHDRCSNIRKLHTAGVKCANKHLQKSNNNNLSILTYRPTLGDKRDEKNIFHYIVYKENLKNLEDR